MDWEVIVRQTQIEHETLGHIEKALQTAMEWEIEGPEFSRKLSSVRFIAQSFQRHLERLFELEEHDGFMSVIGEASPELLSRVDELKREHDHFRSTLGHIMPRLDRASPTDEAAFSRLCEVLSGLMAQLEDHDEREMALLSYGLSQDTGGDG